MHNTGSIIVLKELFAILRVILSVTSKMQLLFRKRQTTPRMDRHETIVTERCETFRYYRYWRISR